MADSPEAAQPLVQDNINKTFEPPKGLEGMEELVNIPDAEVSAEVTPEKVEKQVEDAEIKMVEIVSEADRKLFESTTRAAIGDDPKALLGIIENLRGEGRTETIGIILSTLESVAIEGGESASAAQQAVEQIKIDDAAYESLDRILPQGQLNESALFDQLYILTDTPNGHRIIGKLFDSMEKMGQRDPMEKTINILMVMKMQAGSHAENALLALDQISVYGAKNPTIKEVADQAANMSPEKAGSLKLKIDEAAMFSPEPVSPDNIVAVTPETEEEILARREAFNKANKDIENELDEDLVRAQAETDRIVESGVFPSDWSSNQIFRAKKAYEERQALKVAQEAKAKEQVNAKRAAKRAKLVNNDAAFRNFLGLKPETEQVKTETKATEAKVNPIATSEKTKVAAVVDKTPPKPESPISQPLKGVSVAPVTEGSRVDKIQNKEPVVVASAGRISTRIDQVNPNLKVTSDYAKEEPEKKVNRVTVDKQADDPLDGL